MEYAEFITKTTAERMAIFATLAPGVQLHFWNQTIATVKIAKEQIEPLSDLELKMRNHIVDSGAQGIDKTQPGTQYSDIGNGWRVKAVVKVNHKLEKDNDKFDAMHKQLPEWLQQRLFNWTVALSVTEFKGLSPEHKAIVSPLVTVTNAAPTLTLVPPKG